MAKKKQTGGYRGMALTLMITKCSCYIELEHSVVTVLVMSGSNVSNYVYY